MSPSGYLTKPWQILYKFRIIAGRILYKRTMFHSHVKKPEGIWNNQRMYGTNGLSRFFGQTHMCSRCFFYNLNDSNHDQDSDDRFGGVSVMVVRKWWNTTRMMLHDPFPWWKIVKFCGICHQSGVSQVSSIFARHTPAMVEWITHFPAWCSCLGATSGTQLDMEGTDSKLLEGLMMHSCCSLMVFASRAPPTFRTIQRLCHMFGPKIGIDRVASRKNMFVGNPSFKYLPCWPKKKHVFWFRVPASLQRAATSWAASMAA